LIYNYFFAVLKLKNNISSAWEWFYYCEFWAKINRIL